MRRALDPGVVRERLAGLQREIARKQAEAEGHLQRGDTARWNVATLEAQQLIAAADELTGHLYAPGVQKRPVARDPRRLGMALKRLDEQFAAACEAGARFLRRLTAYKATEAHVDLTSHGRRKADRAAGSMTNRGARVF